VSGFFERVSRYARPLLVEPRENRTTEVFASVLERVDGLALALARDWLKTDPRRPHAEGEKARAHACDALRDDELVLRRPVRTQRFTRSTWFVDLELRFRRPRAGPAEDIVIWVEVKHGATPHEGQLQNYLDDIAKLPARASAVVLLAPRQSYPFLQDTPTAVAQCTWQATAMQLGRSRWRRAGGEQRFLVRELADYLGEEGLMDLEVITPIHLVALAEHERAERAVALACEIASAYIRDKWNDREQFEKRYGSPACR
jgi:hypothetical protein